MGLAAIAHGRNKTANSKTKVSGFRSDQGEAALGGKIARGRLKLCLGGNFALRASANGAIWIHARHGTPRYYTYVSLSFIHRGKMVLATYFAASVIALEYSARIFPRASCSRTSRVSFAVEKKNIHPSDAEEISATVSATRVCFQRRIYDFGSRLSRANSGRSLDAD